MEVISLRLSFPRGINKEDDDQMIHRTSAIIEKIIRFVLSRSIATKNSIRDGLPELPENKSKFLKFN